MHTSEFKSSLIKTKCHNTFLIFFLNPVGNIPKNGGQIIKQLLVDEKYDLSRFTCLKQTELIRRKKLRLVYTDFIHHPHDTLNFWYLPLIVNGEYTRMRKFPRELPNSQELSNSGNN